MERNVVIVQVKHSKAERERETVQKHIRGFLARRRVGETIKKEMANLEKEAIKAVKPPQLTPCSSPAISRLLPNPLITSSTPELLVSFLTFRRKICTFQRTLRRLRRDINDVKAHNIAYETALNVKKNSNLTEYRLQNLKGLRKCTSLEQQTKAAKLIQRVWRGYKTRRDNGEVIQKLHEAMETYRENMNRLELTQDRLQDNRPACQKCVLRKDRQILFSRLYEYTEMLFGTSLYRTKVAAICICNSTFCLKSYVLFRPSNQLVFHAL